MIKKNNIRNYTKLIINTKKKMNNNKKIYKINYKIKKIVQIYRYNSSNQRILK